MYIIQLLSVKKLSEISDTMNLQYSTVIQGRVLLLYTLHIVAQR